MSDVLILDIGKTNIKVHVLDRAMNSVFERATPNVVVTGEPYPHFDMDAMWEWFLTTAREAAAQFQITAISITTHGATAALIDRAAGGNGLVLPVLDYECPAPEEVNDDYAGVRPAFTESYSPSLPAGMNLGRQLYWQQKQFPEAFQRATDILLYPQYWVWRLTGKCCSEVTSLGCHTDLWAPEEKDFSALVDRLNWRPLFPTLRAANDTAGLITSDVASATGLDTQCKVAVGIHDSNASYLRYVVASDGQPFSVISTGTWAITMVNGAEGARLDESRDTLMNVDFRGQPVTCARFMAGREYESICHRMGSFPSEPFTEQDLVAIIEADAYALPSFCEGSGPFADAAGKLSADVNRINGAALASLYCALMLDLELDLLEARGDIFLEGAFLKNTWLCRILAGLRQSQRLLLSSDSTGTVKGAAALTVSTPVPVEQGKACEPLVIPGLLEYRDQWRKRCPTL